MPCWTRRSSDLEPEIVYEIDTDLARLDYPAIQRFLAGSYWAKDIPLEVVEAACAGSVCFGLHAREERGGWEQVGFGRVVTDAATFGYLADVYVLEAHRGRGLSKWLVECVLSHPRLQHFRRWMLATRDAHGLYARFGFEPLGDPGKFMEIARPGLYSAR
jgi:GNAT superfamily N-acetyltransferase